MNINFKSRFEVENTKVLKKGDPWGRLNHWMDSWLHWYLCQLLDSVSLKKGNCVCLNPTDKEMMKFLDRYVIGKSFPSNHNVMEVDYCDRVKMLIHLKFLNLQRARRMHAIWLLFRFFKKDQFLFASKAAPGIWKPTGEVKSIFDGKKRHMHNVKISWYDQINCPKLCDFCYYVNFVVLARYI